jgi:hypothetical protein
MWPALKRGLNSVAIGDGSSGKVMGYLAPLASKHLVELELQPEVSVCVLCVLGLKIQF